MAHLDNETALKTALPSAEGLFGDKFGGAFLPPPLVEPMKRIEEAYLESKKDPAFLSELQRLRKHFIGRPSPIYHCKNLSDKLGGEPLPRNSQPRFVRAALARSPL